MKLKVLNYNKTRAKVNFVLFKFLELFGIFLFFFGFEELGKFAYTKFKFEFVTLPTTYAAFWLNGFAFFIGCLMLIGVLWLVLWLIYIILKAWIEGNWRLAQLSSEDPQAKIERLEEQKKLKEISRIEELEEQRKKYGYCVGDIMNDFLLSGVWEITDLDSDNGHVDLQRGDEEYDDRTFDKNRDKIVKRIKIPKKPKLNPIRSKEVEERKKK